MRPAQKPTSKTPSSLCKHENRNGCHSHDRATKLLALALALACIEWRLCVWTHLHVPSSHLTPQTSPQKNSPPKPTLRTLSSLHKYEKANDSVTISLAETPPCASALEVIVALA